MRNVLLIVALGLGLMSCESPPPVAPLVAATVSSEAPPLPAKSRAGKGGYDEVGEALDFLADDFEQTEPRRARLAEVGALYWSLAAAKQGAPGLEAQEEPVKRGRSAVVVAERHPEHLRIVFGEHIRVTGYVHISSLHEVTRTRSSLLARDGEPYANGCGVFLPPGTELVAGPPRNGQRRVEYRSAWLVARGRLPSRAVDRVYVARDELEPQRQYDCELRGPVTLRDGPSGRVVADVIVGGQRDCVLRGEASAGARRVEIFSAEGLRVDGYAPNDAVTVVPPKSYRMVSPRGLGGGYWFGSHTTYVYLWPGDLIYPLAGSEPAGRVAKRRVKFSDKGAADGGMRSVYTSMPLWGFAGLRIDEPTYRAAGQKYAAWLARVQFGHLTVSGGASQASVEAELESHREQLNNCYDAILKAQPGASFRYEVAVRFAADEPAPTLKALGPTNETMEGCLDIYLRGSSPALLGSSAKLRVEVRPSPLVD